MPAFQIRALLNSGLLGAYKLDPRYGKAVTVSLENGKEVTGYVQGFVKDVDGPVVKLLNSQGELVKVPMKEISEYGVTINKAVMSGVSNEVGTVIRGMKSGETRLELVLKGSSSAKGTYVGTEIDMYGKVYMLIQDSRKALNSEPVRVLLQDIQSAQKLVYCPTRPLPLPSNDS